ncbi:uncharacterized protein LOC110246544 [Exaiptasia diaphana]|uniref:Uncharacterized protein n=1 Tax=Exaiptasia diaphana TaxID=2652724 RepID=A0A913XQE0_EXADI|nr:uncharacterized protein LOC110246544 [Exaiptasia diaphana]KXJ25035.1 hypothetical protein AC249_AIPGENE29228 [Exaiptasia diaphana]
MNWCYLWVLLCVLSICLPRAEQCSPPEGWWPLEPEERAQKAGIVVYGTVVSTPQRNNSSTEKGRFYGVILKVHCIVKGPKLPAFIHVSGFSNFSGGLCVHSKAFLNKSYVIFIKRDTDIPEQFRVLEVNLQKGAMHPGHKLSVLRDVMSLVGENASLPLGSKGDSKPGCLHFKRKFRDPTSVKSKHNKSCRCRRKKQKRKKRKRIKATSRPKNRHCTDNITDVPTLPRTRRYNVVNFEEDKVPSVNILPPSHNVVSFSSDSQQLNTHCFWCLMVFQVILTSLLPT